MWVYLLKSAACLLAFFAFYKLFLERQNMHVFKRFYLLGALLISFGIPFITFVEYIEVTQEPFILPVDTTFMEIVEQPVPEPINYWPTILWSIYFLGLAVFSLRFIANFGKLIYKIQRNPKIKQANHTNVLLQPKITPHTFFEYVFLNKKAFEKHKIPQEVILHEAAHAKQKHSIDVVFIEFLQVVFWFNPLLYIIKKAIKLNHEFLADQAVLQNGVSLPTYQELLLAFSSNTNHPQLANTINYSSFKKRFTVMKTQTTTIAIWLRSLLLLPLLAVLVFSFSAKEIVEKPVKNNEDIQEITTILEDLTITVNKDNSLLLNGMPTTLKELPLELKKNDYGLSKAEREELVIASIIIQPTTQMGLVTDIKERLRIYGVKKISINNSIVENDIQLNTKYKQVLDELAKTNNLQEKTIDLLINKNGQILIDTDVVKVSHLSKYLDKRIKGYSATDRKQLTVRLVRTKETPEEAIKKIEKIVKGKKLSITRKTVNSIVIPPPPPPPSAKKNMASNKKEYYSKEKDGKVYFYNKKGQRVDKDGKAILPPPPPPPIPENATPEQKAKYKKAHQEYEKQIKSGDYNYTVSNNEEVALVNLPEVIEVVEVPKEVIEEPTPQEKKSGYKYVNNETLYYTKQNGKILYFNRWGQQVDKKGNVLSTKQTKLISDIIEVVETPQEIVEEPTPQEQKTGYTYVNGEAIYFVKEENKITYYNRWGQKVDKKGNILSAKQTKATDVIHGQVVSKVYKDDKVVSEFDNSDVNIPPPPPPPAMDTIYTYKSLAKRTKFIPNNRKNNMQYLKVLFNKMSASQKEKVESPSSISNYISQLNNLSAVQVEKVNKVLNKIKAKAKSEGRKFYTAAEYRELEKLYADLLNN